MKKYTVLAFLLISACLEEEVDDLDVVFRDGPIFDLAELVDRCCPYVLNPGGVGSTLQDAGCYDDITNGCAHKSIGGSITGWTVVNCFTCGPSSDDCSGVRWVADAGAGEHCGGTATRRITNEVVNDHCQTSDCTSNSGTIFNEEPCPGEATLLCGPNIVYCSMDDVERSNAPLCCRPDEDAQECVPAIKQTGYEVSCDAVGISDNYSSAGFTELTWCYQCSGYNSSHETYGGWDLTSDFFAAGHEWGASLECTELSGVPDFVIAATFECGGYAFDRFGDLINDNCP